MNPATEALSSTVQAAPSLFGAALRIGVVTAALVFLLWLLGRHSRGLRRAKRLEILDRAVLGRAASVALIRVDESRLLVGVSAEGVRLLRELDPLPSPSFALALERSRAKPEEAP
jgi:flagellar biogenesis protein FliO